jgi:TolB-like protein/Tfp pilus assembly protein PilF
MLDNQKRLSKFWQELKRRNVVRVITVYAGAAFVLLELVDMITEPFGLPAWTFKLAIVILSLGFVVAIILSWIYDVHPEGRMVKTEPADKVKSEDIPKSSNSWKIASYISFMVIVGLIVLNVIPRSGRKEILDKSIAVLPFDNLSTDEENTYFIDGVMESILNNLCQIEDLRVPGRTSVMLYRENPKPISVVAEEVDVAYVLEGSGQKIGNRLVLTVQLITGKDDRHIWSKQYDRLIEQVEDLIDIQKEIAELVANEIEAIITPGEKELMGTIPTTNLTAYDLVLKGEEEVRNLNLDRAEELFNEALELDSTFALAYVYLGSVYGFKSYLDMDTDQRDTALSFINMALYYDDELAMAYLLKGNYFQYTDRMDQAIMAYEKAFKLKPNDYWTNYYIGYCHEEIDYIKCIEAYHRAAGLSPGNERTQSLKNLGIAYSDAGFQNKALEISSQVARLDGDSAFYYRRKGFYGYGIGDFDQVIKYFRKAHVLDSTSHEAVYDLLNLGWSLYTLGKYQESLNYMVSALESAEKQNLETVIFQLLYHRLALVFLRNGFNEEAERYFNRADEDLPKYIEMIQDFGTYYELAAYHAFRGEKQKALEYLRILNQKKLIPFWRLGFMKFDELFDSIRDEPEFQKIVQDMEAKYQAEHERVRLWLEDNDML